MPALNVSTRGAQTVCELIGTDLACVLDMRDNQVWVTSLIDRQRDRSLLTDPAPLCLLRVGEGSRPDASVKVVSATEAEIAWLDLPGDTRAVLRLVIEGPAVSFRLEAVGETHTYGLRLPVLGNLRPGAASEGRERVLVGASAFRDRVDRPIFRHADWPLPVVRVTGDGRTLTLMGKHCLQPTPIDLDALWQPDGVELAVEAGSIVVLQAQAIFHQGGWRTAFDLFRQYVRQDFDLSQYERPDFSWFQDQLVQHFTFLYGREILDLETGTFELDRFLDSAERDFGGYDGFLVWGVYPRIGVDERTQWDFFDDFPGGRDGLRRMARRARERGVRFFIPYKPWDRSADLHGRPAGSDHELLAQLVADVEADGIFLDTMAAVKGEFRAAIDRVRPGVVFCSEGRAKGKAFEVITSSWDQSRTRDAAQGNWSAGREMMPGVDLWRFIFPEHRLFVINRHSQGADRINIIQRGFFNGIGWVVWQDIFGLVLNYSPEEAALLKKCRSVLELNRRALSAPRPTPLIETLVPGIHINEFPCESKRLWTFYNENDEAVDGEILAVQPRDGWHFVNLWDNEEADVTAEGRLRLRAAARGVGAVVELPRLLGYDDDSSRVTLRRPVPGANISISQAGSERTVPLPDSDAPAPAAIGQGATPCRVQLLQDGELLDQIWVTGCR